MLLLRVIKDPMEVKNDSWRRSKVKLLNLKVGHDDWMMKGR